MKDYYTTLGIEVNASREEVRKAFRTLTKKYHPDRNRRDSDWATTKMLDVIEANRVLSNPATREVYDRQYRMHAAARVTKERVRAYREKAGKTTRAEMMLDKLLSGKGAEAMAMYKDMLAGEKSFELKKHLKGRDWVDCKFLIAEEYERQGRFEKALPLYEKLYAANESRGRYKHFMNELRERLFVLYSRRLAPSASPDEAARHYLRAMELNVGKTRTAFLHKKLAECHVALGNLDEARRQLGIAFELKPDLKGATKIREKLGLSPGR